MTTRCLDTRTILIGEDGRHVSLSRYGAPDDAEVAVIATKLAATGQGGWIASMAGEYYSKRGKLRVEAIREVAKPATSFDVALSRFLATRKEVTR